MTLRLPTGSWYSVHCRCSAMSIRTYTSQWYIHPAVSSTTLIRRMEWCRYLSIRDDIALHLFIILSSLAKIQSMLWVYLVISAQCCETLTTFKIYRYFIGRKHIFPFDVGFQHEHRTMELSLIDRFVVIALWETFRWWSYMHIHKQWLDLLSKRYTDTVVSYVHHVAPCGGMWVWCGLHKISRLSSIQLISV